MALAVLALPAVAVAQQGFLFGPPVAGVTLRAGPLQYTVASDVFAQMREQLTLSRGDFAAPAYGAELVFVQIPRFDVVVGAGYAVSRASSEFRDWVEQDAQGKGLPIEQTTELRTAPASSRSQGRGASERRDIEG